jgi:2-(1,2-epoxy-1,2-dihydrophenyl)acetyl-CoA isomerase
MSYNSFNFEIADGIARVVFNQPERGNPMDLNFNTELSRIATECDETPGVRCVLIESTGKYFGVGADLKTMNRDRLELQIFIKNATIGLHSALSRFARMDAPVVTSVHALAVGGFVSLCAAADFCLAAKSSRFYSAYTGIGLVCDGGGSTFLPRRVGTRKATEFYLRNQTWTADEALANGLINAVVDDDQLSTQALSLAQELAAGPTRAFGEIKNLILSTWEQPIEAQMELEARAMARVTKTEDGWSGICEVANRRTPKFVGR